ncbi:ESX secretion-associated protein EspG [Allokutzneria sp. NRRL B-24872]|uniref:ESX secretion-associated protein EspG n=1 Tax=Allokutzneria sp. NRRL B-24872 TaxID=1137961 RepID=UPI000A3D5BE5|nr:ESX secretion-associated protein EspG [Allokutzneria sp. NRRL B-24872]
MWGRRTLLVPAVVYEVWWERLGLGVMPFPLVVFQHGADEHERARARAWAEGWVAWHGLGDELTGALRVVAEHEVELALVHTDREGQKRIGCFRKGRNVLRAVIRGDGVELQWLADASLPGAAVGALPERGAGRGQSAQVPVEALAKCGDDWQRSGLISDGVAALVNAGADRLQAQRFLTVYSAADAMGQASVVQPRHGRSAALSIDPLSWLDTAEGRYVTSVNGGQVTLAPVSAAALGTRFAELLTGSLS